MVFRMLLVRHAQTAWNHEGRVQGHSDPPLSALGERQAERVGNRLALEQIDAAYASDLQRTYRTAELALAGRGLNAQRDPAWRELNFGEWESLTYDDVMARDPELAQHRLADPAHIAPPGGEHLGHLEQRIMPAIEALRERHHGQTVLVVTHGGPLRVLACRLVGADLNHAWRFEATHGGLSAVRWFEAGATIELWNETVHLRER